MIVLDIDGVIADNRGVVDFDDWKRRAHSFPPVTSMIEMMTPLLPSIMFVTARNEKFREATMDWFHIHWPAAIEKSMGFYFRPNRDRRPSADVKEALLFSIAKAGYPAPTLAIDDIDSNVAMFRSHLIPTIQFWLPGTLGVYDKATPEKK